MDEQGEPYSLGTRGAYDVSGSWSDNEGYLTIYTTAYYAGVNPNYSAASLYTVVTDIAFHKFFKKRLEDVLCMRYSAKAVYDSSFTPNGYFEYDYTNGTWDVIDLTPDYTTYGAVEFRQNLPNGNLSFMYMQGQYRVSVDSQANVQSYYIHNESTLNSTSISIDLTDSQTGIKIGFSATAGGKATTYPATPLALYKI